MGLVEWVVVSLQTVLFGVLILLYVQAMLYDFELNLVNVLLGLMIVLFLGALILLWLYIAVYKSWISIPALEGLCG